METESLFIIYVMVFRLAIISAGVISIVLGYRLFMQKGAGRDTVSGASFEAKVSDWKFALKNAGPGTFFALFGVIIISVMIVKGSPELNQELVSNQRSVKTVLRGGPKHDKLESLTRQGIEHEKNGETDKAAEAYQEAAALGAPAMNYLAWLYQKNGRFDKALPLAQSAVMLLPDNAECTDTLAVVLCKMGKRDEALPLMEKTAAQGQEQFRKRLENFQGGACE
ncbi:MAG TPA: tetratricopeptide repeat protein [Thermodesulfovibrionia bacterium]|nr:tetratricopeptide repeat protein [Thermodesulfovibrionia bacterium]